MLYASPEHRKSMWSRRSLLKAAAASVAAGVVSSFSKIAAADDGLRTIGLGVSIVNEVQEKATKDLGFTVAGQAMGYGEMFGKMLNQNDQYEIAEGYFNDMRVMGPAKVWQPIDTKKLKDWDKVTNLTKTGKLTPESNEGQGDAPVKLIYCDADGNMIKGPSQYILLCPGWHNADSVGYNPKTTGRPIESWAELLSKDFKGKVALVNIPQVGVMDVALAIEALGLKKFGDKGNMTKGEIDFLIDYLMPLKRLATSPPSGKTSVSRST
jgi:putative spermidine/putrescine transport system substrate-binding protein